jgi:hypothetical protein
MLESSGADVELGDPAFGNVSGDPGDASPDCGSGFRSSTCPQPVARSRLARPTTQAAMHAATGAS